MKNNKKFVIFLLVLFIFSIIYTYFCRDIVDDELYNFGFAKSILDGRIPYVDFNMIVPPIFHYLLSFLFMVFGSYLIVYHLFLAFLVVGCVYYSYSKIGFKSICLFFLILIYPFTGYNTFCLFLLMMLLFLDDKLGDRGYILEAIIISLIFLSKQTLGLLVIPSLIYSKHKKKTLSIYLVSGLLFLLYLICEHSIGQFIDYCFLGMFEFGSKNGSFTWFLPIELIIILIIVILLFLYKKKELAYVLCFQVMAFPAFDYVHFIISIVPVVYLLLKYFGKNFFVSFFMISFSCSFFLIFSLGNIFMNGKYHYLNYYNHNGFMKGKLSQSATYNCIQDMYEQLNIYSDYTSYILGNFSYLVKLNLDIPINKFDIINKGNMGYYGGNGYIKEINNYCKDNKCVFLISDGEARGEVYNQVDRNILLYVQENYNQVYSSSIFSVYVNDSV